MAISKTKNTIVEFGDFQTPESLAHECMKIVYGRFSDAKTVIEPTCGVGQFLTAAVQQGKKNTKYHGWEVNAEYVAQAKKAISSKNVEIIEQNFFSIDWEAQRKKLKEPLLFVGNPPWVTSAALGTIEGKNVPKKSNFQGHSGFDAISGKANFDISEWMLIQLLHFIEGRNAGFAFLIKTSVARKLYAHASKNGLRVTDVAIYEIDAKESFGVSVDACLFIVSGNTQRTDSSSCNVYSNLQRKKAQRKIGYTNGKLIADIASYKGLRTIDTGSEFGWRSGVKHDNSKIMEFKRIDGNYINGLGEIADIPNDYVFPMYKSSTIAKDPLQPPKHFMLVTQTRVGEDTSPIASLSPKTWDYLRRHEKSLTARRSTIYQKAPPFAIFGVGAYTFCTWKIAISGMYKNKIFQLISSHESKTIVLDDTCYSIGFEDEKQARFVYEMLTSQVAKDFIDSIVFDDNKRPVTVAILNRINIKAIANILGMSDLYDELFTNTQGVNSELFIEAQHA